MFNKKETKSVTASTLPVHIESNSDSEMVTELLYGETVDIIKRHKGWAHIRNHTDNYEGYVHEEGIDAHKAPSTHKVVSMGSFLYSKPDFKSPILERLSFLSTVTPLDGDDTYVRTEQGYLHRITLAPVEQKIEGDVIKVARQFLGVPYKWGGRSTTGLDCSAFVQLVYAAIGISLPRDTRQQRAFLTEEKPLRHLAKGDLIFIPRHVMMGVDRRTVIHANATHMAVAEESLRAAMARMEEEEVNNLTVKAVPF